jgi:hypothetical protein
MQDGSALFLVVFNVAIRVLFYELRTRFKYDGGGGARDFSPPRHLLLVKENTFFRMLEKYMLFVDLS